MSRCLVAAVVLTLGACATSRPPPAGQPTTPASVEARRDALKALLAEHWDYVLAQSPEYASILGDKRFNDRSSDLSAAAVAARVARTRDYLARFEAIDASGLPEQEALTQALMVRELRRSLDEARFEDWKMPVNQMEGIHLQAARLPSILSFRTVKDYDDYLARMRSLPRQFADVEANMRLGVEAGLVPPRFLLEKVAAQAEAIGTESPEQSPFAAPLAKMPEDTTAAERERIRKAWLAVIRDDVLPAYRAFARFVREEYAPRGRAEPGLWALPDGAARYASRARRFTTTQLAPAEIHEMGLREVARIEAEMVAVAQRAGFPDLASFRAALAKDPRLKPTSREQILEIYRGYLDGISPELPRLFGRLPKAGFVVVPVEQFREKAAAAAQYMPPAPDGSRPGRIEVNTGDFAQRSTLAMESTAYHEGVPGHHLQGSIQQEIPGLPPQRRLWLWYNAYGEGWALYAERLGEEVGRYKDPASYYGHLQDEMLRAMRLVVDTGLHEKRWTRDQVVQFFRDHSSIDEVEVQAETDRYIAWPGQALAYKVGELKIRELRERARKALGPTFDVRQFHDQVLGAGALPLDVLEARIDAWVAAQGGARPTKS
ncbi:MAG TPA: DUF885 family protein [Anaeromyxobacteraceae bacterium]|nr:DUF885 family protein [Anaeromyxobacteraceae bacterium]